MSFNITSDGSPTPRKGSSRLAMVAGDLKIDTTPEVLSQAVGGMSLTPYPYAHYRAFGTSLTPSLQGAKQPLGTSTQGNQGVLPLPTARDGYKVSQYLHIAVALHACTH
jgi:hypothetical protein